MTRVTPPSIAYVATQVRFPKFYAKLHTDTPQVRFALSSSPIFSRTDLITDSERFYNSVLDLFEDIDEKAEVDELLTWWNRSVFSTLFLKALLSECGSWSTVRSFRRTHQGGLPSPKIVLSLG
jgi:hypothetical protein